MAKQLRYKYPHWNRKKIDISKYPSKILSEFGYLVFVKPIKPIWYFVPLYPPGFGYRPFTKTHLVKSPRSTQMDEKSTKKNHHLRPVWSHQRDVGSSEGRDPPHLWSVYLLIEYPQLLIFVGEIWHKSPILGGLNHVLVVCWSRAKALAQLATRPWPPFCCFETLAIAWWNAMALASCAGCPRLIYSVFPTPIRCSDSWPHEKTSCDGCTGSYNGIWIGMNHIQS